MIRICLFIFCLCIGFYGEQAHAIKPTKVSGMPSGLYKSDPAHTSLIWKVDHLGLSNYTARFTDVDIDLMFDAQNPLKSRVRATVDPTSIETHYPDKDKKDFNKKLAFEAGWFNANKFPTITFRSTSITKTDDKKGTMIGDVTLLGITKSITFDVIFNKAIGNHPLKNKPVLGFSATGKLKRSDFGMTTYLPQIGDMINVVIETEFLYTN